MHKYLCPLIMKLLLPKMFLFAVILGCCSCDIFSQEFRIRKFTHKEGDYWESLNKGKPINNIEKQEYFIVTGFKNNDKIIDSIKAFVESNKDSNCLKYKFYSMSFFEESKYTNEDHLAQIPRDFVRHSQPEDQFLIFSWGGGKFLAMDRIKDGYKVYPENSGSIEIKDVQ